MGILRNLMGSTGSTKSAKLSPQPSDADFAPRLSPTPTTKDDSPKLDSPVLSGSESPVLGRMRTIRQADYRTSSDAESERVPIIRGNSDSPRSPNPPSTASASTSGPPPYRSPPKTGLRASQSSHDTSGMGGRPEEQARIKGEKRARRRSAEGEARVGGGLGLGLGLSEGMGQAKRGEKGVLQAGMRQGDADGRARRGLGLDDEVEAAAVVRYQTTLTTVVHQVTTTTTTMTQVLALPRRTSSRTGAPVLPPLPSSGSPLSLSPSFTLDESTRFPRQRSSSSTDAELVVPLTPRRSSRTAVSPESGSSATTKAPGHQRSKHHQRLESADLPPLPHDKSLPSIPKPLIDLTTSFSSRSCDSPVPESIVITPSTPARLPGSTRDRRRSNSPASPGHEGALDIGGDSLGRSGTIRPSGTLRAVSPSGRTETGNGRKLRHVRSLGIGIPSQQDAIPGVGTSESPSGSEGQEVLISAPANASSASLSSGLSVSFGDVRRPERKPSSDSDRLAGGRSPSPVSALFGKLRGASQPVSSISAAKSTSAILDEAPSQEVGGSSTRRPPALRKAKSFSSFFGMAEKAILQEAIASKDLSPGEVQVEGAVMDQPIDQPQMKTKLGTSPLIPAEPDLPDPSPRPAKAKLLRGPSGWFSGFRKSSQRDKQSTAEDPAMEMEALTTPDQCSAALTEDSRPQHMPGPMAIPVNPNAEFERPSSFWSRNRHSGFSSEPASLGEEGTLSPPPGMSSPGINLSPRSGSLGYFPSISEYSATSSRVPSTRTTPAVTPGIPDIITSSSTTSIQGGNTVSTASTVKPTDSPHSETLSPGLSRSLGGPIVFKRPRTPERSRGSSDTPETISRGQSVDEPNYVSEFGQVRTTDRPSLGQRSNSASSLALDRMKSMVSKSGSRPRSSSVLRAANGLLASPKPSVSARQAPDSPSGSSISMASTYGARLERADSPINVDSGTSSRRSSFLWHPNRSRASSTADSTVLPVLDEMGPSRRDLSPVVTLSSPKASFEVITRDVASESGSVTAPKKRRPRASTLFTTRPPSPTRSRSSGNLFPPPKPSRRMSSTFFRGGGDSSEAKSPSASGSTTPNVAPPKVTPKLPVKEDGDGPAEWLERLLEVVDRAEVANVLASKNDPFFIATLEIFMQSFDFAGNALDIALRKLLMVASLPRETQQIDRVMDAFAKRYNACHPGLFLDPDHTYVIAFSMIMLHTDAFNKNNKRKMTKQDYTRNTRMPGVSSLVLETFYDNTCYTPFRFIEDDQQSNFLAPQGRDRSSSSTSARTSKLDIYSLLAEGQISKLRVKVLSLMSEEDPISYHGSRPFFDYKAMRELFLRAPSMEVARAPSARSTGSKLLSPQLATPGGSGIDSAVVVSLKIVKAGLLSRKDDLTDGTTKAANRKWRSWSVVLTASQIIFIREPTWALSLLDQIAKSAETESGHTEYLLPRQNDFRPEEVVTLASVFAVFDSSYTKYPNSFRLILPQGRQYILQASDGFEMNEWIAAINWASAYKSSGIAMFTPTPRFGGFGRSAPSFKSLSEAHDALMEDLRQDGLDGATIEAAMNRERFARPDDHPKSGEERYAQLTITGSPEMGPASPSSLVPRAEAISVKISEYRNRYIPLEKQVEEELRIARCLDILTPFEKATRDKIEASVPLMAAKLHRLRVQLAAYRCWIDVLEADVAGGSGALGRSSLSSA